MASAARGARVGYSGQLGSALAVTRAARAGAMAWLASPASGLCLAAGRGREGHAGSGWGRGLRGGRAGRVNEERPAECWGQGRLGVRARARRGPQRVEPVG